MTHDSQKTGIAFSSYSSDALKESFNIDRSAECVNECRTSLAGTATSTCHQPAFGRNSDPSTDQFKTNQFCIEEYEKCFKYCTEGQKESTKSMGMFEIVHGIFDYMFMGEMPQYLDAYVQEQIQTFCDLRIAAFESERRPDPTDPSKNAEPWEAAKRFKIFMRTGQSARIGVDLKSIGIGIVLTSSRGSWGDVGLYWGSNMKENGHFCGFGRSMGITTTYGVERGFGADQGTLQISISQITGIGFQIGTACNGICMPEGRDPEDETYWSTNPRHFLHDVEFATHGIKLSVDLPIKAVAGKLGYLFQTFFGGSTGIGMEFSVGVARLRNRVVDVEEWQDTCSHWTELGSREQILVSQYNEFKKKWLVDRTDHERRLRLGSITKNDTISNILREEQAQTKGIVLALYNIAKEMSEVTDAQQSVRRFLSKEDASSDLNYELNAMSDICSGEVITDLPDCARQVILAVAQSQMPPRSNTIGEKAFAIGAQTAAGMALSGVMGGFESEFGMPELGEFFMPQGKKNYGPGYFENTKVTVQQVCETIDKVVANYESHATKHIKAAPQAIVNAAGEVANFAIKFKNRYLKFVSKGPTKELDIEWKTEDKKPEMFQIMNFVIAGQTRQSLVEYMASMAAATAMTSGYTFISGNVHNLRGTNNKLQNQAQQDPFNVTDDDIEQYGATSTHYYREPISVKEATYIEDVATKNVQYAGYNAHTANPYAGMFVDGFRFPIKSRSYNNTFEILVHYNVSKTKNSHLVEATMEFEQYEYIDDDFQFVGTSEITATVDLKYLLEGSTNITGVEEILEEKIDATTGTAETYDVNNANNLLKYLDNSVSQPVFFQEKYIVGKLGRFEQWHDNKLKIYKSIQLQTCAIDGASDDILLSSAQCSAKAAKFDGEDACYFDKILNEEECLDTFGIWYPATQTTHNITTDDQEVVFWYCLSKSYDTSCSDIQMRDGEEINMDTNDLVTPMVYCDIAQQEVCHLYIKISIQRNNEAPLDEDESQSMSNQIFIMDNDNKGHLVYEKDASHFSTHINQYGELMYADHESITICKVDFDTRLRSSLNWDCGPFEEEEEADRYIPLDLTEESVVGIRESAGPCEFVLVLDQSSPVCYNQGEIEEMESIKMFEFKAYDINEATKAFALCTSGTSDCSQNMHKLSQILGKAAFREGARINKYVSQEVLDYMRPRARLERDARLYNLKNKFRQSLHKAKVLSSLGTLARRGALQAHKSYPLTDGTKPLPLSQSLLKKLISIFGDLAKTIMRKMQSSGDDRVGRKAQVEARKALEEATKGFQQNGQDGNNDPTIDSPMGTDNNPKVRGLEVVTVGGEDVKRPVDLTAEDLLVTIKSKKEERPELKVSQILEGFFQGVEIPEDHISTLTVEIENLIENEAKDRQAILDTIVAHVGTDDTNQVENTKPAQYSLDAATGKRPCAVLNTGNRRRLTSRRLSTSCSRAIPLETNQVDEDGVKQTGEKLDRDLDGLQRPSDDAGQEADFKNYYRMKGNAYAQGITDLSVIDSVKVHVNTPETVQEDLKNFETLITSDKKNLPEDMRNTKSYIEMQYIEYTTLDMENYLALKAARDIIMKKEEDGFPFIEDYDNSLKNDITDKTVDALGKDLELARSDYAKIYQSPSAAQIKKIDGKRDYIDMYQGYNGFRFETSEFSIATYEDQIDKKLDQLITLANDPDTLRSDLDNKQGEIDAIKKKRDAKIVNMPGDFQRMHRDIEKQRLLYFVHETRDSANLEFYTHWRPDFLDLEQNSIYKQTTTNILLGNDITEYKSPKDNDPNRLEVWASKTKGEILDFDKQYGIRITINADNEALRVSSNGLIETDSFVEKAQQNIDQLNKDIELHQEFINNRETSIAELEQKKIDGYELTDNEEKNLESLKKDKSRFENELRIMQENKIRETSIVDNFKLKKFEMGRKPSFEINKDGQIIYYENRRVTSTEDATADFLKKYGSSIQSDSPEFILAKKEYQFKRKENELQKIQSNYNSELKNLQQSKKNSQTPAQKTHEKIQKLTYEINDLQIQYITETEASKQVDFLEQITKKKMERQTQLGYMSGAFNERQFGQYGATYKDNDYLSKHNYMVAIQRKIDLLKDIKDTKELTLQTMTPDSVEWTNYKDQIDTLESNMNKLRQARETVMDTMPDEYYKEVTNRGTIFNEGIKGKAGEDSAYEISLSDGKLKKWISEQTYTKWVDNMERSVGKEERQLQDSYNNEVEKIKAVEERLAASSAKRTGDFTVQTLEQQRKSKQAILNSLGADSATMRERLSFEIEVIDRQIIDQKNKDLTYDNNMLIQDIVSQTEDQRMSELIKLRKKQEAKETLTPKKRLKYICTVSQSQRIGWIQVRKKDLKIRSEINGLSKVPKQNC